jgi:DHA1 family tetracycline resistance protein-like MFS transporter
MKRNLGILYLTVAIDFLGVGLVIPIFAPLFLSETTNLFSQNTDYNLRSFLLGVTLFLFPFFQFFGAPILGTLSDKYGRKNILFLSVLGTFLGYILMILGIIYQNLYLIVISRIIDGFTGGNISVATSAISDISDKESRVKNFGMLGAIFGFCFILGPFIGGKLSDPSVVSFFSYETPFIVAGVLSLINLFLISSFFKDTLANRIEKTVSFKTGIRNLIKAFTEEKYKTIFITVFLISCGFSFFTQFFQAYLVSKFSFSQSEIGELFAYIGIWIVFTQGFLVRVVPKNLKPSKIVFWGTLTLGIFLISLIIPEKASYIYFIIPFVAISNGLLSPNSQAIISELADENAQGEIFGINQSVQSLGVALAPLISGIIYSLDIRLPILLAGVLMFLASLIFKKGFKF